MAGGTSEVCVEGQHALATRVALGIKGGGGIRSSNTFGRNLSVPEACALAYGLERVAFMFTWDRVD